MSVLRPGFLFWLLVSVSFAQEELPKVQQGVILDKVVVQEVRGDRVFVQINEQETKEFRIHPRLFEIEWEAKDRYRLHPRDLRPGLLIGLLHNNGGMCTALADWKKSFPGE